MKHIKIWGLHYLGWLLVIGSIITQTLVDSFWVLFIAGILLLLGIILWIVSFYLNYKKSSKIPKTVEPK